MADRPPAAKPLNYSRRLRMSGRDAFLRMGPTAVRITIDPLQFRGKPNGMPHPRLGLSVPRRVGTAVVRNRIKRLLREAFRLSQHDWPAGYDLVISVRPHEPLTLRRYRDALHKAMHELHQTWTRKTEKAQNKTKP